LAPPPRLDAAAGRLQQGRPNAAEAFAHAPDRYRELPGRPDIVLPKHRTVVFVHGCFWHRHGCALASEPATRRAFWREKFARNVARDKRTAAALRRAGWRVLTVWECALRTKALREQSMAALVRRIIARRSAQGR
jgi:DNA mismatch endonuclease (patch repair protein)